MPRHDLTVFIVDDDAANREAPSPAYVLSPYARRGFVDSAFYNQTSVLRTIELILAMRPMTHFDAAARPMSAAFQTAPDLTPFTAEKR